MTAAAQQTFVSALPELELLPPPSEVITPFPTRWTWRKPAGRLVSAAVGFGALGAGLALGGAVSPTFWLGLLGPDIPLYTPRDPREHHGASGQGVLHTANVEGYNKAHGALAPALTVAAGLLTINQPVLVGGLGWLAHVGIDRACTFGLRAADGRIG